MGIISYEEILAYPRVLSGYILFSLVHTWLSGILSSDLEAFHPQIRLILLLFPMTRGSLQAAHTGRETIRSYL